MPERMDITRVLLVVSFFSSFRVILEHYFCAQDPELTRVNHMICVLMKTQIHIFFCISFWNTLRCPYLPFQGFDNNKKAGKITESVEGRKQPAQFLIQKPQSPPPAQPSLPRGSEAGKFASGRGSSAGGPPVLGGEGNSIRFGCFFALNTAEVSFVGR